MNAKDVLQSISNPPDSQVGKFDIEKFIRFFRLKNDRLKYPNNPIDYKDTENNFTEGRKLAEGKLDDGELIVCSFLVKKELTERSGKKAQYTLGKKILKEQQADAGIFIFYDPQGNFRFSLIYTNYLGKRRDWSNFKRFTYFVSPEFTNKTFLRQIGEGDFSTLEKIKEAFSVEKVTKEFYEEIANWYFWAVRNTTFPEQVEKEENGRNIAIIRLITRIIFIWFMRELGLISPKLFDYREMVNLLNELTVNSSTYYKAILQNLFFATLNTKIKDREFRFQRTFQGKNQDYMNHTVYRYEKYFKNKEKAISLFKDIPFLNGGLFDCLDRRITENGKNKEIRLDGFTDKEVGLNVPNYLFFSEEKYVDLNKEYGTENKKYKFQGLINILSAYNFTIDENVPDDQEVALDPELLGKVFENLLASYNPETASTARKATGSYYTPREIVDYMVSESLKEYFKTHLKDIEGLDKNLDNLFSTEQKENPFTTQDTRKIVELIDNLRIVDPAVGSGAFPMGILNKLVFILSKLDPENKLWQEVQLNALDKSITDPVLKNKLKEQTIKQFAEKNSDYGRKLYLIQKCIYGVDIQQIAVEIAKLRFFISLLVDEKIDKNKENWGIEPLPNLDFKIMQGNSLISEFMGIDLDADEKQNTNELFEDETSKLIKEFQNKKNEFQNEPDKHKKDVLMQEINKLIIKIFEAKLKKQKASYFQKIKEIEDKYSKLSNEKQREEIIEKEKQSLYKKEGFNLESIEKQLKEFTEGQKTKPFFAWKLYFAEVFQEKQGFDIVIANPPYIDSETMCQNNNELRIQCTNIFQSAKGNWDLFVVFIEKGLHLQSNNGIIAYIVPNKLISAKYTEEIRKIILNKKVIEIRDYSNVRVFKDQDVYPIVFIIQNSTNKIDVIMSAMESITDSKICNNVPSKLFYQDIYWDRYFVNQDTLQIVIKITQQPLLVYSCSEIFGASTVGEAYKIKKYLREYNQGKIRGFKKFVNTGTIDPYVSLWGRYKTQYIKNTYTRPIILDADIIKVNKTRLSQANSSKIIIGGMSKRLECFFDTGNYLAGKSTIIILESINNKIQLKFLLGLLNSRLISFWYKIWFNSLSLAGGYLQIGTETIKGIPIPQIKLNEQQPFISIVDKILSITKDDDYLENPSKQAKVKEYERQIDQLVYKLYGLTEDEIKIVEEASK